jgi:hypothetical protein
MSAPTEQEIREIAEREFADDGSLNAAGRLGDAFGSSALDVLYDFEDLRASEEEALNAAVWDAIRPIRDRAIAECKEALVVAGLRFAAEHPDAPRAVPKAEPVPA